jgi:hypothetical protein
MHVMGWSPMADNAAARVRPAKAQSRGQALVLFALFLLVLLGASALAIDYANWLLTDRRLQNIADHAALAGAAMFEDRFAPGNCSGGSGQAQCDSARAQAWTSLNADLGPGPNQAAPIGLDDATIACLSQSDTPIGGWTNANQAPGGCGNVPFGHRLWVSTPPPNNTSYTGLGGQYALNYAVVFVRVDEATSSYLGRALGIGARDRIGWATAGPLPTDFALEVFCRNGIAPQSGACGGSGATALVIDGQGGIRLVRGDIGSNESLKVTATNGGGVVTQAGNVFLVNGNCSQNLWRCPNGPPSLGGISDGYNGKNAFKMPPQPVPHYASPLSDVTVTDKDCTGADATHLCVPYRPWASGSVNSPGDWACDPAGTYGSNNICGQPCDAASAIGSCDPPVNGTIRCDASIPVGVTPSTHLVPNKDLTVNTINGTPVNTTKQLYTNIDDDPEASGGPQGDSVDPPPANPVDEVYLQSTLNNNGSKSFDFALRPPFGIPETNSATVRFVAFKADGSGTPTAGGNQVDVKVELFQNGVNTGKTLTVTDLPGVPTRYEFDASGVITNFNGLSLKFTFTSGSGSTKMGGGIAWAELQTDVLDPALPPMIPPGYYHSITIPDGGCAVMDPTSQYYGYTYPPLALYQKAGIYRFGGGNRDAEINVGIGSFLIGDGVTLVFDPDFPDPSGGRGVIVGAGGALVLNTMRTPGVPPCTPTETEGATYNPSEPLALLPYSSVCAAWAVDANSQSGLHAGTMLWTAIDPSTGDPVPYCIDPGAAQCIERSRYGAAGLSGNYRGITFYFTTSNWPATTIRGRFQMGGSSGSMPGIAFRGVMYAPYDDVKISGGNGFDTVGQVLAWTAKFNGGNAYIDLDYPYQPEAAPPYLLEPTVGQ